LVGTTAVFDPKVASSANNINRLCNHEIAKIAKRGVESANLGYRYATAVGSDITAFGADEIIIDGPVQPKDALSERIKPRVRDWVESSVRMGFNDPIKGAMILVAVKASVTQFADRGDDSRQRDGASGGDIESAEESAAFEGRGCAEGEAEPEPEFGVCGDESGFPGSVFSRSDARVAWNDFVEVHERRGKGKDTGEDEYRPGERLGSRRIEDKESDADSGVERRMEWEVGDPGHGFGGDACCDGVVHISLGGAGC